MCGRRYGFAVGGTPKGLAFSAALAAAVVVGTTSMGGALAQGSLQAGTPDKDGSVGSTDKINLGGAPTSQPEAFAGKDGFGVRSDGGRFTVKVRGYAQADGRFFLDDEEEKGVDTFLLRRVRPVVDGTLWGTFDFRVMPDFGDGKTVLQEAYIDSKLFPEFRVKIGKFKTPFGIERLQSATAITFVERALPTALVPNRDIGIQASGELLGGTLLYAAGAFNGVLDGSSADSDTNDGKDIACRLVVQPFRTTSMGALKGLGIGGAATWGKREGNPDTSKSPDAVNLPKYKSSGQQTFFSYSSGDLPDKTAAADGDRRRTSVQGSYYWGPVGLLGEYVVSKQEVAKGEDSATLSHTAWQGAGSVVLFGGDASYQGVNPASPLSPAAGTWGALEIAARNAKLTPDSAAFPTFADADKSARSASSVAVGINYYINTLTQM